MEIKIDEKEIERIVTEVINRFLIPRFRELGMPATGEWEDNVHARGNEIWGRDYTEYLVEGRPPNENQDPEALRKWAVWAGNTFIKDWAEAKGIAIDPIAIAYKIGRDGTDWYPEGSDLLEVLESPEVATFIADEIGRNVIIAVQTEFTRQFEEAFA